MQQIYPKNGIFIENRTNSPRLQAFAFCVANFYSTVVCKHFEDLKALIIWSMLKKLVFSWLLGFFYLNIVYSFSNSTVQIAMIKFRSKFQFQILLQFYRTVEKVETCDGNGQKIWQVPSHFGYYFVFSWLSFKHIE